MQKFNIKEGPYLGQILKNIERYWIENKFKISDEKINEILKN